MSLLCSTPFPACQAPPVATFLLLSACLCMTSLCSGSAGAESLAGRVVGKWVYFISSVATSFISLSFGLGPGSWVGDFLGERTPCYSFRILSAPTVARKSRLRSDWCSFGGDQPVFSGRLNVSVCVSCSAVSCAVTCPDSDPLPPTLHGVCRSLPSPGSPVAVPLPAPPEPQQDTVGLASPPCLSALLHTSAFCRFASPCGVRGNFHLPVFQFTGSLCSIV